MNKIIKENIELEEQEMYLFYKINYDINGYKILLNVLGENDKRYLDLLNMYEEKNDELKVYIDILLEKYMPNYAFGNFPFKYEIYPDIYHNSLEVTIVLGDNNGK